MDSDFIDLIYQNKDVEAVAVFDENNELIENQLSLTVSKVRVIGATLQKLKTNLEENRRELKGFLIKSDSILLLVSMFADRIVLLELSDEASVNEVDSHLRSIVGKLDLEETKVLPEAVKVLPETVKVEAQKEPDLDEEPEQLIRENLPIEKSNKRVLVGVIIACAIMLIAFASIMYSPQDSVIVDSDSRDDNKSIDSNLPANPVISTEPAISTGPKMVIAKKSDWMFHDKGMDYGASNIIKGTSEYDSSNWKHPDFEATGWSSGKGILGFGRLHKSKAVTIMGRGSHSGSNPITSYFRKKFTVNNADKITNVRASILADDAVIVYLNGVEIYRSNLKKGIVVHSDRALKAVSSKNELSYNAFNIDALHLIEGVNLIAVELHQVKRKSTDLGFDMDLEIGRSSE